MAHGDLLLTFTDAVLQGGPEDVEASRDALVSAAGAAAATDASAVVAMFTIMTRIADATGTPMDGGRAGPLVLDMGEQLGMSHLHPEHRREA